MENISKGNEQIIEVYQVYADDASGALGALLDATNGIVYRVKTGNWLVLETADTVITIGCDGVNIYPNDDSFFMPDEWLERCVDIFDYEEFDSYERTLFLGESLKGSYEKDGHYFAVFDDFSLEVVPIEETVEVPWYERRTPFSYKYSYGCERLIKRNCPCGGEGKILQTWRYDYVVRCERCNKATEETTTVVEAINKWEAGDVPCCLHDIVIE